ncbi:hypothetical protein MMC27_003012 [Xylographa pallens]|nr:hypothetical protein [Xylographa pallens]
MALVQQGSVDWGSLAQHTVSFSVEILSRFSKAGVELITVAVGQALFSQFNLPASGQQRLQESLARLRAFSSYGNILWFGIGIKHIVRSLAETEQGASCTAVCACLAVTYDTTFSARILKVLCDSLAAPKSLTPSLSQWASLVDVCAGALTSSQFPRLVEGLTLLIVPPMTRVKPVLREATTPEALGLALLELAKISNGTLRSVVFHGGADCGWLAAVAEWLLSLRVEIINEKGVCVYRSQSEPDADAYAQVVIMLQADNDGSPTSLVHGRTHLVPSGGPCFEFRPEVQQHIYSYGRSEWSTILRDTFGRPFDVLLSPRNIPLLTQVICSGFRFGMEEQSVSDINPWPGPRFLDIEQRHRKLLGFAALRLPELKGLLECYNENPWIDSAPKDRPGFSEALTRKCICAECRGAPVTRRSISQLILCLQRLAVTIFDFLWMLSWLDIDEAILPSASGLMMFYMSHVDIRLPAAELRSAFWKRDLASGVLQLFTGLGNDAFTSINRRSALCGNGVCVYYPSLENPACGPRQQLRVRVVPGQIEYNGAIFRDVCDGKILSNTKIPDDRTGEPLDNQDTAFSRFIDRFGTNPELQLVAQETLSSTQLDVTFVISPSKLYKSSSLNLGIAPRNRYSYGASMATDGSIGPFQLRVDLLKSIYWSPCQPEPVKLKPIWTASGETALTKKSATWSGRCSIGEADLWTCDPEEELIGEGHPRSGEWVLIHGSVEHQADVRYDLELLRGTLPLLYCVLSAVPMENRSLIDFNCLVQVDQCLMCMAVDPKNPPQRRFPSPKAQQVLGPVLVHSRISTNESRYELRGDSTRTRIHGAELDAEDPRPKPEPPTRRPKSYSF